MARVSSAAPAPARSARQSRPGSASQPARGRAQAPVAVLRAAPGSPTALAGARAQHRGLCSWQRRFIRPATAGLAHGEGSRAAAARVIGNDATVAGCARRRQDSSAERGVSGTIHVALPWDMFCLCATLLYRLKRFLKVASRCLRLCARQRFMTYTETNPWRFFLDKLSSRHASLGAALAGLVAIAVPATGAMAQTAYPAAHPVRSCLFPGGGTDMIARTWRKSSPTRIAGPSSWTTAPAPAATGGRGGQGSPDG